MVYVPCVCCGASVEISEEEYELLTEEELDDIVCEDCDEGYIVQPGHIEIIEDDEEDVEEEDDYEDVYKNVA